MSGPHLLQTRVLFANEFAGIAVSMGTPGWGYLDISPIKKMSVDGLRRQVRKRGQEIVGILPEGHDHPMRVILKDVPHPVQVSAPAAEARSLLR